MKKTGVLVVAIILALAATGGVLAYKMTASKSAEDEQTAASEIVSEEIIDYSAETEETSAEKITEETSSETTQAETTSAKNVSTTKKAAEDKSTTLVEKLTTVSTTVAAKVNTSFNKIFTMPKAPKYVPPDVDVDFDTASLLAYKYDPDGNYFYTDDKNSWQRGFGYNQIYDSLAVVSAMYYDTVRNTFTYDGKDWLIQLWKGQYGYYFVGGEMGIYTKTKSGGTYACADKEDWLKMEMTFFWDQNKTGSYSPIFSRPYTDYWWCTGFVLGFESVASMKSRTQFRLVGHITFKSTEMAELFCTALEGNGFKRVSMFDKDVVDTFVQSGADVGFCWQNINQHVI